MRKDTARRRIVTVSLNARLTLLMGAAMLFSILVSLGIVWLVELVFPALAKVPQFLQLAILVFFIATVMARLVARIFCDPIQTLRKGMHQVAGGDFSVRLQEHSTSVEIQEMFEGFNLMAQELGATEILQTDFISNVSHEFKTPINAIEGYTTLLQSTENLGELESTYIEKILFNTKRLSSLVSNILLLSKLENQSIQTNRQRFALDEQIRESIVALERTWEEKEIEFDVELETVSYYGSEKLLFHVWSNLLSNAIKFSPRGSKITIRLEKQGHQILFYVEDQGPGLSEDAKKHIFDKFYQEDTSHKEEGNGLGLALVKRILALTGGSVAAENRPEGGCRFTVLLYTEA